MASKLISQYGFSKDNMKVILGGWNTWKENNGKDPNGYPIDTTAGAAPVTGGNGGQDIPPGVTIITPGANPPAAGTPVP